MLLLSVVFTLFGTQASIAQKKLNWHANFGVGMTDMRNFNTTFNDLQYGIREDDASIEYKVNSKPDYLISAGMGVSGSFRREGILGWDAGLNIRTGGFRVTANALESEGELSDFFREMLPDFGKTESFRYWALHVPFSLNYRPFEIIGFTFGGDLYYQLSSSPTDADFPHGRLGRHMGFSPLNTPKYQHPFQLGGHIGIYAPIGEKLRLDVQFVTDLSPRLTVDRTISEFKFREMGLMLNVQYKLGW
ncbi:hypothetical protein [Sphingobacterium haloxyli]|uniref:hypothetical protein n=1 Tax=Sphingobacterium haloxyli TaxID=2100533 RepID=UPI001AA00754|nr:hypothetical protein [Sphingobacterium haloxyli]